MQRLKPFLLPLVAAVVLLALLLFRPAAGPGDAGASGPDAVRPGASRASGEARPRPTDDGAAPTTGHTAEPPSARPDLPAGPPARPSAKPSAARTQRDAMRQQIARAMAPPPPADPTAEPPVPPEAPTLDKDYIRTRIKDDLLPIAQECYESALQDDTKLGGRLTMQFTIVGADDVGGVVDEVSLAPDTEITHPDLVECMTESMLSVTFAAPPGDGTVSVTYPFIFEAEPSQP